MDIQELAQYLKLAPVTLYKMVKEERIPCRRIGKSLRFPKAVIDQWLLQGDDKRSPPFPPEVQTAITQFAAQVRKRLENVLEIRLFGSWARGEGRLDSDIDMAVFVAHKDLNTVRVVSDIASEVSLETDKFVSAMVLEMDTHRSGKKQGYPFHRAIDQEGIPL